MIRHVMVLGLLLASSVAHAALDAEYQDVRADITGTELSIDLTLMLRVEGTAEELVLLTPSLPVIEVEVDGTAAELVPHGQYPEELRVVPFNRAFANGSVVQVHLVMRGVPDCDDGQGLLCAHNAQETVLIPSSPGMAWHYLDVFSADAFLGSLTVIAPENKHVVCPQGSAQQVSPVVDGKKTWTFGLSVPQDALFIYARAGSEVLSPLDTVRGYHTGGAPEQANMERAVNLAEELLPFFNADFGPISVDQVHLMAVPPAFPFGGMGLLGNIFFGDYVLSTHDYLLEQGTAHELAHSWWGNLASAEIYEEGLVLQEGLAEYSAWKMLGALRGDDVRISGVRMNSVWYIYRRPMGRDVAPLDPDVASSPVAVFAGYHKASSVFRTLEEAAGEEAFTHALAELAAAGPEGMSIQKLLEKVETWASVDVGPDVDQWLRRTGFPYLRVGSSVSPASSGVDVELSVEVLDDFAFLLPVRFVLADGTTHDEQVRVRPGMTTHTVSLPSSPVLVQADPEWTLVRVTAPMVAADVTMDGAQDAADLIEVALRSGGVLPEIRRQDGKYDPLFDVNGDERIDDGDLSAVLAAMGG